MQTQVNPKHNSKLILKQPSEYYAQVFDTLAQLAHCKTETEAIQIINKIFSTVFQTNKTTYISLMGDLILSVNPRVPPEVSQVLIQQARDILTGKRPSDLTDNPVFAIANEDDLMGVLAIQTGGVPASDLEILEIGHRLSVYTGVVISNIRSRQKLVEDERLLQQSTSADGMTGLSSRRYFFEIAEAEFKRSKRYNRPLSAILVGIDDFNNLNKMHGAHTGDRVLMEISRIFNKELRDSDIRVRMGGEELLILLPETTLRYAQSLAERLRLRIADFPFEVDSVPLPVTISLGVVGLDPSVRSLEEFINNGDHALYQARKRGNNQVAAWGKSIPEYEPVFHIKKETDHRIGFY